MQLPVVNHPDYVAKINDDNKFPIKKFGALASHLIENKVVKEYGERQKFDFKVKDHVDVGAKHGLDFELGTKLSGARFVCMKGDMARFHRAIGQMMLDIQTQEHGYEECYTPYLVNEESLLSLIHI